jgi:hypothetical protein
MAEPSQYLNNKRKYLRYDYPSVLQCFLTSEPLQSCEASTINVSAGGVCLSLCQRLSIGQHIEIGKNILPIYCKTARVCWVREISNGNYLAGIEFYA